MCLQRGSGLGLTRWVERWRDFGGLDVDPRSPGPLRWMSGHGEIRARLVAEPPAAVPIAVGDTTVAVRPLADVERDDPAMARLPRRLRARHTFNAEKSRAPLGWRHDAAER